MAKRVGARQDGESPDAFMKKAMLTTTPIINSYVDWKSSAQKKVQALFGKKSDDEVSVPPPSFIAGSSVPASSTASVIYDAAGNVMRFDEEDSGELQPVLDTAFDATVWPIIEEGNQATAGELQETVGVVSKDLSDADFGTD